MTLDPEHRMTRTKKKIYQASVKMLRKGSNEGTGMKSLFKLLMWESGIAIYPKHRFVNTKIMR